MSSQNSASESANLRVSDNALENDDQISKLPDDILLKILSNLSTEEAIRTCTLSKRWENTWKHMKVFGFNMLNTITFNGIIVPAFLNRAAQQITQILNDHIGHIEACQIIHYSHQLQNGTIAFWIQLLTNVKHTKQLSLANSFDLMGSTIEFNELNLPPNSFNHRDLRTVSLLNYRLPNPHAFNNCQNLKQFELIHITGRVGVFNQVISSCPSLEYLFLQIIFSHIEEGQFKIDNKNLRVLNMSCSPIESIQVYAPRLDILSLVVNCEKDKVVFETPRLSFRRNYWVAGQFFPHTSINISNCAQESEDKMLWGPSIPITRHSSVSVSVDLKNPKEVKLLKKFLDLWRVAMVELEISFKNNIHLEEEEEEGESSNGGASAGSEANMFWEEEESFPNDNFRVDTVWLYNFSGSDEYEFELVSRFVKQKTVMRKIMIKTHAVSNEKKIKIEEAIVKLTELSEGNEDLTIECF